MDRRNSPRLAMRADGDDLHTFRRYPRISTIPPRTVPMRRNSSTFPSCIGSWRKRARWLHKLKALLKAIRMVVLSLVLVAVFFVTNLAYHVLHKPDRGVFSGEQRLQPRCPLKPGAGMRRFISVGAAC